jgi:hypothetical protein
LGAVAGQRLQSLAQSKTKAIGGTSVISEDGRVVARGDAPSAPLPAFDPRSLKGLVVPGGALILRDKLYVERSADAQLKEQMVKWGTTTTVRAPPNGRNFPPDARHSFCPPEMLMSFYGFSKLWRHRYLQPSCSYASWLCRFATNLTG